MLNDAHDEGEETFVLALSNASGAWLEDAEATGTIENTDLMPAALLARFGRATAEQVVEHVEQRMSAPRSKGFRGRFAGRELRPGMGRDFALDFLSRFGQARGMGPEGAGPMDANPMGGASMGANPMEARFSGHGTGATGMTGQQPPMDDAPGGGSFGSMLPGGNLFSNSEFELNREQYSGVVSVWSRSSRSHFGGMEGALSLNGDMRTTMLGADYTRGPLVVGLTMGRSRGMGGYGGRSVGQVDSSMMGFYPWLGYKLSDRVSVWCVTGYGTGSLRLTPDAAGTLETGMSMAMAAMGTRGFSMGRVSLTPRVEVGLRQDGGDAETGAGMDVGGGLVFTDAVTGLSLDVRVRTLVVHQADGFTERGMSLSFGWDPTPSSPPHDGAGGPPPVMGRAGRGRRRGALERPDGIRSRVAPPGRVRRPGQRGGGLRAPRGPLRRNAAGRLRDLGLRPGLPAGLQPRGVRRRGCDVRVGRRRAATGEPVDGRHGQRGARAGLRGLVAAAPGPHATRPGGAPALGMDGKQLRYRELIASNGLASGARS